MSTDRRAARDQLDDFATSPLRSVHTTNFPELVAQLGISLLVTTYQAGRLVILRGEQGKLNTHFRVFPKPMGLASRADRLAIATRLHIMEFHNQSDVAAKLEPAGKHDACYLPRTTHVTGDIFAHEIAFAGSELWIANTRFSCLCTLDSKYSFVPRWMPKFVTQLLPEDRCHLNGLAVIDGKPRYVTALGTTDSRAGWRANKANGGILMDVEANEIIARGLSMPHSPRWYNDQLWVLESGDGSIATVDKNTGQLQRVARLPGFTRGLDFCGPYAFVGLSQIRQSAVFSGIPITERLKERLCGVYVVDLRTGQNVAFLRFEDKVQEIFAVQVLPRYSFPELLTDEKDEHLANSWVVPQFENRDRSMPGF